MIIIVINNKKQTLKYFYSLVSIEKHAYMKYDSTTFWKLRMLEKTNSALGMKQHFLFLKYGELYHGKNSVLYKR